MPSAAALLEIILAEGYTQGMLRAANTAVAEVDSQALVKVVAPRRFEMPRPEKPAGCYSRILKWEVNEEKVVSAHNGGYEERKYQVSASPCTCRMLGPKVIKYLHHGGSYVQRLLAQSRATALLHNLATVGWSSDDVPPWPPLPQPVPEASTQAICSTSTSSRLRQEQEDCGQTSHRTPLPSGEVPAGYYIGRDGEEWPLPPRECMASPFEDFLLAVRPELQWSVTSRLTAASPTVQETADAHHNHEPSSGGRDEIEWPLPPREYLMPAILDLEVVSHPTPHHISRPGYFIGRGGLEWPLPPLECIDRAIVELYRSPSTTTCSSDPVVRPGFYIGRGGLEWPFPPAECIDRAVIEAHRDTPAPTYSVTSGTHHSKDAEVHDSPSSVSTSSSTDSMLPVTPPCGPIELTDWRGLHIASIGDSHPVGAWGKLAVPSSPPVRAGGLHDVCATRRSSSSLAVEDDFFRRRDESWWPLPPTDEESDEEPDEEEEEERRGRSPTPKWSMLGM